MIELDTIVCSDALDFMRGLPPQSIDLIATDMPYGTTACSWDVRVNLDHWWECVRHVLKPRGVFLTTASQPFTSVLVCSSLEWFRYEWIWEKSIATGFLDVNHKPLKTHENILVFYEHSLSFNPQMQKGKPYSTNPKSPPTGIYHKHFRVATVNSGVRYPITILHFPNERGNHPTQKPVALYEYLIKTYTQPGDLVLDPFIGSGTTGLAARKTGRHYIGCDSSQEYVDLANQRIANADPYQPTTHDNGVTQLSLFGEAE